MDEIIEKPFKDLQNLLCWHTEMLSTPVPIQFPAGVQKPSFAGLSEGFSKASFGAEYRYSLIFWVVDTSDWNTPGIDLDY